MPPCTTRTTPLWCSKQQSVCSALEANTWERARPRRSVARPLPAPVPRAMVCLRWRRRRCMLLCSYLDACGHAGIYRTAPQHRRNSGMTGRKPGRDRHVSQCMCHESVRCMHRHGHELMHVMSQCAACRLGARPAVLDILAHTHACMRHAVYCRWCTPPSTHRVDLRFKKTVSPSPSNRPRVVHAMRMDSSPRRLPQPELLTPYHRTPSHPPVCRRTGACSATSTATQEAARWLCRLGLIADVQL